MVKNITLFFIGFFLAIFPVFGDIVNKPTELMNSVGMTTSTTGATFDLNQSGISRCARMRARLTYVNNSGDTPTLDAKIQVSPGDTVWKDFITFTQKTTSSGTEDITPDATSVAVFTYARAVATLGGTDPDYDITITFYCD